VVDAPIKTTEEALAAAKREAQLELAKDLREQWSKLTADAQAIDRKTQELLQAIMEHEATEGLMLINYCEPKCLSTILFLQAEHCLKRARALERAAGDIGEWVDIPIPTHADAFSWPGTVSSVPPPLQAPTTSSDWPEHLPSEEEHERAKWLWRQRGPLAPEKVSVKDM